MSEPKNSSPELDLPTREAIAWVVRLRSEEATAADANAFARWRALSPENEAALTRAAKLWRDFVQVAAEAGRGEAGRGEVIGLRIAGVTRRINPVLARRAFIGGAIAAATAGVVVFRPPFGLWPSYDEITADYRTGKGEQRRVALTNDVSLELNTLTSIAVRSTAGAPQVELISGEAVFATSREASTALVVIAAGGRISAGRANFNARCIDGAVSVTCLEGAVEIERGDRSVQLRGGQQASYSPTGLGAAAAADPVQATAWQSGLLIFRDKPLGRVVDEINRYRSGRIIITNAALRNRVVNGTFYLDRLDNFVAQVEQLFGAKATSLPGGVTLLS